MSIRKFILCSKCFATLRLTFLWSIRHRTFQQNQRKQRTARSKFLTTPGGLLLTIDGKPRGETTD